MISSLNMSNLINQITENLEAARYNYTIYEDIKMDSNFVWLLCSLVSAIAWIIYITYYNSRVLGCFVTKLINELFLRDGYMQVGMSS